MATPLGSSWPFLAQLFTGSKPSSSSPSYSPKRKCSFLNQMVYNVFIAPVYTAFAAFGSLLAINALLFLCATILFKLATFACTRMGPHVPIEICAPINGLMLFPIAPKRCRLPLALTVSCSSIAFGLLSTGWPISIGALLGLNAFLLFDGTLLDELIKQFAFQMVIVASPN